MSREYGFFSWTTVRFTARRLRYDGLRCAVVWLWQDFTWNVIKGQPMYDHTTGTRERRQGGVT